MAKLYREARSGIIVVQEATKLVCFLQALAKVIEASDLEQRLELLEARQ